jgi:hypothetical protein
MTEYAHIPSDEEVGLTRHNSRRRATIMCICTMCHTDYEVRDGKWIETHTKRGTKISILICASCYKAETGERETKEMRPAKGQGNG